ncbi:hypothetical protein [Chryseobacterium luquanense]|uniref:Uncharacterized protein n=1 Tax=Chryseobacterium luquanense TaxID=2983766 RepID=A0ABT3XZQ2_9FLAO|nr:hypothetical protein [Chryseobacterium luquanense]MCX8531388.1 hypothetical protein [Chryseobacterium luquanense]
MIFEKNVLLVFCIFFFHSCAQSPKENAKEMNEYYDQITNEIKFPKPTPFYTLQINKQDCRVLIRINDIPLAYTFFEDEAESQLLPINDILAKSGEQIVTIEVYPKSNQQTISDKAHVNIKLIYAAGRDISMQQYEMKQEFDLPEALGDQKLPKYIIKGSFRADVPWDFSKDIATAKDLSKVPDIEKKVVDKYKQLSYDIFKKPVEFIKESKKSLLKNWNYNYFTKKENMATGPTSEMYDFSLKDREMDPIENYEINFYCNNRLVTLRNKNDKSSLLEINYMEEGYTEKSSSYRFVILYIPEGSNEFKIF